jgi:hypothetical protein
MMNLEKAIWIYEQDHAIKFLKSRKKIRCYYYWSTEKNKAYFYSPKEIIEGAGYILQFNKEYRPYIDYEEMYDKHLELMALLESKKSNKAGSYYEQV